MRARLATLLRRLADHLDPDRSGWLCVGPHTARMWAEDWGSPEDAVWDFLPRITSTLGDAAVAYED